MSEPKVPIRSKRKRRWLARLTVGLCALVIVGIVALPVWLPWLLLPGLRLGGVEVGSYDRLGYHRLALHEVRFANENLIFTAERIETLQPLFWAGRLVGLSNVPRAGFGTERPERMPIEVQSWRLELPLAGPPAEEPRVTSFTEALDLARTAMDRVSLVRPGFDFRQGTIEYQEEILEVRRLVGGLDRIEIELDAERLEEPVMVEVGWVADRRAGTRFTLEAATRLFGERLLSQTIASQAPEQAGWDLDGNGSWGANDWQYEGRFGRDDWWPAELTLAATDWRVSLAPWSAPGYTGLEGGIGLRWADESLEFAMDWQAVPLEEAVPLGAWPEGPVIAFPPVSIEFLGHASFDHARLDRFSVESPGLTVDLDETIEVDLATMTLSQPGRIDFAVRLEELALLEELISALTADLPVDPDSAPLHGMVSGTLRAVPNPEGWPEATLEVRSAGFGWSHWHADALELEAGLEWPSASLSAFRLELQDGTALTARGQVRIPERWLDTLTMRLELAPGLAQPFLPDGIDFERLVLQVEAEGEITDAFDRLSSSGQIEVTALVLPSVQPLEPVRIRWEPASVPLEAEARSEHHWQVALRAAESTIDVAGAIRFAFDEGWIEVPIDSFEWQPGVGAEKAALPAVRLDAPVTVALREAQAPGDEEDPVWTLSVPEAIVQAAGVAEADAVGVGERSEDRPFLRLLAEVTWPRRGEIELSLEGWNAWWLRDWLVLPEFDDAIVPVVDGAGLDRFHLAAGWDGGPLGFSMEVAAHAPNPMPVVSDLTDILRVTARMTGDEEQVRLDSVRVEGSRGVWLDGKGALPLVVVPGAAADPIRWDPAQPLEFLGTMEGREDMLVSMDRVGQGTLSGLAARIEVGGSTIKPTGEIRVGFDRLALTPSPDPETEEEAVGETPPITEVRLILAWRPDAVELESLDLTVAGQAIHLRGTLPLAEGFWKELPESMERIDPLASHGRVQLGPIRLDALRPFLPAQMRAQGEIAVDAHWEAGLEIGGTLEFSDLATLPLPTSGAVQEIRGRIELDGNAIRLAEISADLGGRRIGIEGWVDLEPTVEALVQQRPGSAEALFALPLPLWDIAVTADRLPVVRRPGTVIRTGLDIRTTHDGVSTPLIAGVVTPQDSVFITDIRTMVPRGPATPMPRPPFVQIDDPLIGDWRLDIQVQGDEFLRVRSPAFRGVLSVGMTASGRLREPILVGDVMIADGQVQFPFGNLQVTQGLVSLSELDPTTLTLLVNATSRVYGYQVTMTVSGTAESPAIVFSSNPPLASEAILLMLTAGQLPQDELTFTAQQRATALASYLGKTLIDSWALEEPGEERIVVRSGESISVGGRSTYHLEFIVSERWSLIGEYDEYDAMNAGIKFRLLHR